MISPHVYFTLYTTVDAFAVYHFSRIPICNRVVQVVSRVIYCWQYKYCDAVWKWPVQDDENIGRRTTVVVVNRILRPSELGDYKQWSSGESGKWIFYLVILIQALDVCQCSTEYWRQNPLIYTIGINRWFIYIEISEYILFTQYNTYNNSW